MVSLGTGELSRCLPYQQAKNWGAVRWAMPMLDVVLDGVSRTVDYQLRQILPGANHSERYYRFQATLDGHNHRLDDAGARNIAALRNVADKLIERESPRILELCETLTREN